MIIIRPIISEKSMKLAAGGEYTFQVNKKANKNEIARVVKDQFKVDVLKVSTILLKPKTKMQRRARGYFTVPSFKKAVVKVKKGQTIAIFETPKEETTVVTTAEGEPQVLREKKDIFRRTKVKVEKGAIVASPTTQRKVITGK